MLGLTDVPGHGGKVTSDINFILTPIKGFKSTDTNMNRCLIVGCYGQRLEITQMNLNMNMCLEYQYE